MDTDLLYTGIWVPSNSMPDYLEYVFPSDEDFEPALKKRRLERENASIATTSVGPKHEPQCCEIQGPFTSLLRSHKQGISLKDDGSNEIKDRETRLKKCESTEHSPTWEDFFQYMVSQDPSLVMEPVIFTHPVAKPVNFTMAHVVSPNTKRGRECGHRSRAQSTLVVQGNKVRHLCNTCTKTFPTARGLKLHQHTHKTHEINITSAATPNNSYPGYQVKTDNYCNICSKTFPTSRGLKIHKHTHKTHEMKITSSANTKKSLAGYQALTENHQHHLGHKPFICPLCDRGFTLNQDRLVHLVTQACTRAGRILRRITGGWKCTICDQLYSIRHQAECHTRRHQHGRGMSCPVCDENFTGYRAHILLKHVKNRHPEYLDTLGC